MFTTNEVYLSRSGSCLRPLPADKINSDVVKHSALLEWRLSLQSLWVIICLLSAFLSDGLLKLLPYCHWPSEAVMEDWSSGSALLKETVLSRALSKEHFLPCPTRKHFRKKYEVWMRVKIWDLVLDADINGLPKIDRFLVLLLIPCVM